MQTSVFRKPVAVSGRQEYSVRRDSKLKAWSTNEKLLQRLTFLGRMPALPEQKIFERLRLYQLSHLGGRCELRTASGKGNSCKINNSGRGWSVRLLSPIFTGRQAAGRRR